MRRTRSSTRHPEPEASARRRHPTALWVPDVEEMRRRLADRPVTPASYLQDDEPA